jgi:hypothetical protein
MPSHLLHCHHMNGKLLPSCWRCHKGQSSSAFTCFDGSKTLYDMSDCAAGCWLLLLLQLLPLLQANACAALTAAAALDDQLAAAVAAQSVSGQGDSHLPRDTPSQQYSCNMP